MGHCVLTHLGLQQKKATGAQVNVVSGTTDDIDLG